MKRILISGTLLFVLSGTLSIVARSQDAPKKLDTTVLYEKSLPAIVFLICVAPDNSMWQGSGVLLRSDGVIATNYHVCGNATSASVKLRNGDIYDDVSILETDERKDVAVLKIKGFNLPYLITGDSDALKIGATVYAIGAPRGLEGSISSGIVSSIRSASEFSSSLQGFRAIQFTAPISPGSSGGPLLDEWGKVVGLTTATRTDGQNINIAIPINYVTPLASSTIGGKALQKMAQTASFQDKPRSTGTIADISGTYTGSWSSNTYDVAGALVLTVKVSNGVADVSAVFTGSEYFNQDSLETVFTSMGSGVWKMDYKGKKSKIKGTGLFKGGRFIGDYTFKKWLWTDHGAWSLDKSN